LQEAPLLAQGRLVSMDLVGFFAAYLASRTLAPGTHYLQVFRVVGCVSFMGYGFAYLSDGVWNMKPWSMSLKHLFDGLVYGLAVAKLTAEESLNV